MITIQLTDAQVASILQQYGSPQAAPVVVPVAAPTLVLPAELTGRSTMVTTFPWIANRKTAPGPLNDGNAWLVKFTAGPVQAAVATMQAAEAQGGQIPRLAMLIRDHDGAILWRQSKGVSTVSAIMSFNPAQPTGPFAAALAHPVIETGVAYTLAIWNVPGSPAGLMLAELVL